MAEENLIKINPNKASTLEFEVTVSGLEGIPPIVRFVIYNAIDGVDWVVSCSKIDKTKWQASFPALPGITADTTDFAVEVIVDEYYFKPAEGKIAFVNTPGVSFKPSTQKPSVTTSFTVKQDEPPAKKPTKKVVKEAASGGGEITGQYAPTSDLLQPEEDPAGTESHVKVAQAALDDQYVDAARLEDITDEVIPGEGVQYPQDDGKDESEVESNEESTKFDPKDVAESIIQQTLGLGVSHRGVEKRGSLFKRDADGKIIVPGLENPKQKQELAERERRVKEILTK